MADKQYTENHAQSYIYYLWIMYEIPCQVIDSKKLMTSLVFST